MLAGAQETQRWLPAGKLPALGIAEKKERCMARRNAEANIFGPELAAGLHLLHLHILPSYSHSSHVEAPAAGACKRKAKKERRQVRINLMAPMYHHQCNL